MNACTDEHIVFIVEPSDQKHDAFMAHTFDARVLDLHVSIYPIPFQIQNNVVSVL